MATFTGAAIFGYQDSCRIIVKSCVEFNRGTSKIRVKNSHKTVITIYNPLLSSYSSQLITCTIPKFLIIWTLLVVDADFAVVFTDPLGVVAE
jgi:hypothetical protein